jgi:hypothetical protein
MKTIFLLTLLLLGIAFCADENIPRYGWRIEEIVDSEEFQDAVFELTNEAIKLGFRRANVIPALLIERLNGANSPYGFKVNELEVRNSVVVSFKDGSFQVVFSFKRKQAKLLLRGTGFPLKIIYVDYVDLALKEVACQ